MLFNSTFFILYFLPAVLVDWHLLQKMDNPIYSKVFLVGMSLWFYGYYNPWYLFILLFSVFANYFFSYLFVRNVGAGARKMTLCVGLLVNLGLLFYFKYFNFFVDNCNFFFAKYSFVKC